MSIWGWGCGVNKYSTYLLYLPIFWNLKCNNLYTLFLFIFWGPKLIILCRGVSIFQLNHLLSNSIPAFDFYISFLSTRCPLKFCRDHDVIDTNVQHETLIGTIV